MQPHFATVNILLWEQLLLCCALRNIRDYVAQLGSHRVIEGRYDAFVENLFPLPSPRAVVPTQILPILPRVADSLQDAQQGEHENRPNVIGFILDGSQKPPRSEE